MKATRVDASGLLLLAMAALLLGGIAAVYFAVRSNPVEEALSGDRIVNTLIVLEKDGKPFGTFVLMYYPETKRSALFDVPGELGLIIRSLGRVDRIDALYKPKRIAPYLSEISGVLGIEIPFTLVFNLDGLKNTIDLLGGINLFIADQVSYFDSKPPVLLPSGDVRLDGDKALLYATFELPDEDGSEIVARRQRFVLSLIKALGDRYPYFSSPSVWPLFLTLPKTNLDHRSLSRLLAELSGVDTDRVTVQRVGGNLKEVSGQVLLFPYYDGSLIKDIVKQSLASLSRVAEGGSSERVYTVEVLNGTPSVGLARKTAELLQGFGYDTVTIANAERGDYERTEIIDRSGDAEAAKVFADVIHCESIRSESRSAAEGLSFEGGADFTIIVGKDFDGRYVVR